MSHRLSTQGPLLGNGGGTFGGGGRIKGGEGRGVHPSQTPFPEQFVILSGSN